MSPQAAQTSAAVATGAAATGARLAGTALAALGGPIGALITLLSLAGLAWVSFGNKAESAADKAEAMRQIYTASRPEHFDAIVAPYEARMARTPRQ